MKLVTTNQLSRALGLLTWLFSLDESVAWYEGLTLNSWKVTRRSGKWVLTIQVQRRVRKDTVEHLVAFVDGNSPYGCFDNFARLVTHAQVRWREDQYPPNVGA